MPKVEKRHDGVQGEHLSRSSSERKGKALSQEDILAEEVSMLDQNSDLKEEAGLLRELKVANYVRKSLSPAISFSVFVRIFLYHLFFPLSVPFVVVIEGRRLAHAMQFMLCLEPIACCRQIFKGQFLLLVSQYVIAPLSTMLLVFYAVLLLHFGRFPCLSIVNVNILAALGYFILRTVMIGLKYAMAPKHELQFVKQKPFYKAVDVWDGWHLGSFLLSNMDSLRQHIHVTCLQRGVESPLHHANRFGRQSFNFVKRIPYFKFTPHTKSGTVFNQFLNKKPTAGERILPLQTLSKAEKNQLPFEIQSQIQEYYCSVTNMKEHKESDYLKFMDYFAVGSVKLPSSKNSQGKGEHCIYLRVDVREVLVRILIKHTPSIGNSSLLTLFVAIAQSLVPWLVAIATNPQGLGDFNAKEIGRAAYERFRQRNSENASTIVASLASYDCARFNSSQFPVMEGVKYSIAGDDPFWQGATVFMTISGTILHVFYAFIIYLWLSFAIADYTRRCNSMKALDEFIKKQFVYVEEGSTGRDPAADNERNNSTNFDSISLLASIDEKSHINREDGDFQFSSKFLGDAGSRVRAKSIPPLLRLDSSENVNSFFMARQILKRVGEVYHFRMQALAFCILLSFFFAIFAILYTKIFLRYSLSVVLTTTAAMLFLFGAGGVLEMVHQGGLANYQISRCLTYVDEQCVAFFDDFQEFHAGEKEATALAIRARRDELRLEWERHPVRIFFLPAGNVVYRLIFTITLSFITYLAQDVMINS